MRVIRSTSDSSSADIFTERIPDLLEVLLALKTYLVAQTLGSDDSNLIADPLVGLEVQSQLGIVSLNDDLGGLLNGLGTNATHFGGDGRELLVDGEGVMT